MANYCDFIMRVKGDKDSIEEFGRWLEADYNIDEHRCSEKHHFYRVVESYLYEETECSGDFTGTCAWSVNKCMRDAEYSYFRDYTYEEDPWKVTLDQASEELGLVIEIYSVLPGIDEAEHIIVDNGELLLNQIDTFDDVEEYERNAYFTI